MYSIQRTRQTCSFVNLLAGVVFFPSCWLDGEFHSRFCLTTFLGHFQVKNENNRLTNLSVPLKHQNSCFIILKCFVQFTKYYMLHIGQPFIQLAHGIYFSFCIIMIIVSYMDLCKLTHEITIVSQRSLSSKNIKKLPNWFQLNI